MDTGVGWPCWELSRCSRKAMDDISQSLGEREQKNPSLRTHDIRFLQKKGDVSADRRLVGGETGVPYFRLLHSPPLKLGSGRSPSLGARARRAAARFTRAQSSAKRTI